MTGDSIKQKILKLLALAESSNPHEAELATAQAERLMVKWGIETAELQATGQQKTDPIVEIKREYKGSFAIAWLPFVGNVCYGLGNLRTLQSRSAWDSTRTSYIVGHQSDVDRATMLLNSLEIQAASAMKAWWKGSDERKYLSAHEGHLARRQFLISFSHAVSRRLREMRMQEVSVAGSGTDLVLVDRRKKVDDYIDETYTLGKNNSQMAGSFFGRTAGLRAGEQASLGGKGLGGERGALKS